ncbi:acyltransferase [Chryseolinea sp. T2]|uniref:acyltransferase n=1 Tax=Chryseolinea sp. T2 TaxID=3129255 RepID=UPI003077DB86
MKSILNFIISRIKKERYVLDHRIPNSYMLLYSMARVMMVIRGKLSFIRHKGILFIGKRVEIKARSKMTFGVGVTLDDHTYLDALSSEGLRFGDSVSVGKRTVIECTGNLKHLGKGMIVGNNVGLGMDSYYGCPGGISIGDDTIIGNYVSFHAENHNYKDPSIPIRLQGVNHQGIVIGRNCWIGAKATILDGAVVEDGCIIAANCLLPRGRYKANSIYGGNPAKFIKERSISIPEDNGVLTVRLDAVELRATGKG